MKHIFIVNPAAGKYSSAEIIKGQLNALPENIDYEIYVTKGKNDAERYIKSVCESSSSPVRFYACGGDGTVNEVVNGAAGYSNASFSVYPCGSGNDFVKSFGHAEEFLNIKELVNAEETPIDLLKVGGRYCVNVCNFGFDSIVAETMINVKHKPIIGGRNAYLTGVVKALFTAMNNKATVIADGEKLNNGKFLLCTAANGMYVGGQFKCAPYAKVNDGIIDVCLVKPISRFTFIKLVGVYTEGKHLEDERFKDILKYRRCKKIEVISHEGFKISVDGEIVPAAHFTVEIVSGAVKIALPEKLMKSYAENEAFAKK